MSSRRLGRIQSHLNATTAKTSSAALPLAGKRVLFCGFCQEVSTFNPVPSPANQSLYLRHSFLQPSDTEARVDWSAGAVDAG